MVNIVLKKTLDSPFRTYLRQAEFLASLEMTVEMPFFPG